MRISDWSSDVCSSDLQLRSLDVDADDPAALQAFVSGLTADYAATDEKRDPAREAAAGDALRQSRGIEVGHIFFFGTKYSAAMGMTVQGPDGSAITPQMGSYGIGVSRSEEHKSELQSLMRISYAVFCWKNKTHEL